MVEKNFPFLEFLYKKRKVNISILFFYIILSFIIVIFVFKKEYTSDISILPAAASFSQGMSGKLGNLSKLAGIDIGGVSAQSQEMFMGIIKSRRLLEKIIFHEYQFQNEDKKSKMNLIEFFEIEGDSKREIDEKAYKNMRENVIEIDIDGENMILYLNVTTENPFLSALIANRIVNILNDIVKSEVQKEYRMKLKYLQDRLYQIEDSLKVAEIEYKVFLENNQDPTTPEFQVQNIRLQRNLQMQTELLIEFRKQLEIFIADNMANLADIKILDQAIPSYKKSRPKRALLLITFMVLFGLVHIGINASIFIYRNLSLGLGGTSRNDVSQ